MTLQKVQDILPNLPTEMATENLRKIAPQLSSEWLAPRHCSPGNCQVHYQVMPRSGNAMYIAGFQEQKHTPIVLSMTTDGEPYLLLMNRWHIAHTWLNWCILPPSNGPSWVTYEIWRRWRWQARKLTWIPKAKYRSMFYQYYPSPFQRWPLRRLNFKQKCETKLYVESEITITIPNHQWIQIPIQRSKLHYNQATMAIDNQYDAEAIERVTIISSGK